MEIPPRASTTWPKILIGQVAKESGLAASAIRFYEQSGVLPKPVRVGGRRQYDPSILERLAVLERAKAAASAWLRCGSYFMDSPTAQRLPSGGKHWRDARSPNWSNWRPR